MILLGQLPVIFRYFYLLTFYILINVLAIKSAGNKGHGTINTKENENRKDVGRRKSCKRNDPTLLYSFKENEKWGEEEIGGTASAAQYIYVDACPTSKV